MDWDYPTDDYYYSEDWEPFSESEDDFYPFDADDNGMSEHIEHGDLIAGRFSYEL